MIRLLRFAIEHYLVVPLGVVVALVWANTAPESYYQVAEALWFIVNDIGMAFALAFLMQEVVEAMLPGGTLHPWSRGALPIVAAVGGTLGAIAMYQTVVSAADEPVLALGWPIASAVDIAVGFLVARSIFGRHAAVTFLLLLAIASDTIGLVLVSQRYPVGDVYPGAAGLIVLAIAAAIGLRRSRVRRVWPYVLICGTLSWFGCFWSGVHPALALLPVVPFLPHSARDLNPVIDRARGHHQTAAHFEYVFRYPVQVVAFLFGLVNGGVLMRGFGSGTWAVLAAALVGRPLGILVAVGLGLAAGLRLPRRLGWRELVVIAFAASSGFTFALFFATAVFPVGPTLTQTKIGALATIGATLLALAAARLLRVGRFAIQSSLFVLSALMLTGCQARPVPVADPPEVRARQGIAELTLTAASDARGRDTWLFNGQAVQPAIRLSPGDVLKIHYVNALPATPREPCDAGPCMNMTNLHFHGLTVSPKSPQDDVLDLMAMPGEAIDYTLEIPRDHTPGLNWYHTHPHGESHRQVLDGLSGALLIEGIERYAPEVRDLRERVLVIRGVDVEHDPGRAALRSRVDAQSTGCGANHELAERVFSVNGVVRPQVAIAPGEQQFWRMVNASADTYVDLELDRGAFDIVALDGMPLNLHNPERATRRADHVLVPPAGRLEAIVKGPADGTPSVLRTRCVDTGPDGDPNPAMILADVVPGPSGLSPKRIPVVDSRPPTYQVVDLENVKAADPHFVMVFSEDKDGFYINGQKYTPDAEPMVRAKVGEYQHWRVVNATRELHPVHIHQVHFLAFREDGRVLPDPEWLDTINVPVGGSVDVIMDFTDPVIRGMSVFHCHLLNHEDKGMMAKILFQ